MEAERLAIEEYRQSSQDRDRYELGAGLCVVYFVVVVNQEPCTDTARSLVLEQASALKSVADDMQVYELKDDAMRRKLPSDFELMAYLRGWSLLVGHKGLSVA